ncbi:hypothetical protein [Amycolatopsis jejuensis]|uniref:hypothetical protein n=1 Tax=Amycolatopsis jejuensis TaxID=330084 RepID=UPI000690E5CA|nr:hypothetical protein [Amycolatopsis jejuensis]
MVEVWNGRWTSDQPWNADNQAALADWERTLAADLQTGSWRPAMGSSDTHLAGQLGIPRTVVFADELATEAILAGIRTGRSWIAESANVDVSFTATADGRSAGVGVRWRADRSAGSSTRRADVSFHTDRRKVHRAVLPCAGANATQWHTTAADSAFVRLEVRHPDGAVAALTNPIILT